MPTGTVIFWLDRAEAFPYGFIQSDDAPDAREANVWFSSRALRYDEPRKGDRVSYRITNQPMKIGRGPTADVVELVDDSNSIETLEGEDNG